MEYIVIIIICVITIIFLKIGLNVHAKDIKLIKQIGNDQNLNEIANKFPENKEICQSMLNKLNNSATKIEENEETKTSLYLVLTNKVVIAKIKDTFTRIQTIAHECLHSIQNRKILLFNFIFSNIFLLSFVIFLILMILQIGNPMLYIQTYTVLSLIYLSIRIYIETEAMSRAKYLAKEYMKEYSLKHNGITQDDINTLVQNYERLNKIGIPLTNFWLVTITVFKIIILTVIACIN